MRRCTHQNVTPTLSRKELYSVRLIIITPMVWIHYGCARFCKQIAITMNNVYKVCHTCLLLSRSGHKKAFMFGDVHSVLSNLMTFAVSTATREV